MRLTARHDRILDDLRSSLEDWESTGDTWETSLEMAMNDAWDALLKVGGNGEGSQ